MTSTSKSRACLALALLILAPLALLAQESVMQRGNAVVEKGQTVLDVVVAEGDLIVRGRVEGSVFVVSGDVMVESGAVVKGQVTVLNGGLWVARDAEVEGEINVLSGKVHLEEGARVGSEVRAMENVSNLTPERLAVISRYIVFERAAPPPDFNLSRLRELDLSAARLRQIRDGRPQRLELFELGRLAVPGSEVGDSFEVMFRGPDLLARVEALRFTTVEEAERFWDKVRAGFEEKTTQSVHNSLGPGAHWFFRHRSATYCLWMSGATITAVMVRHDHDEPKPGEWELLEAVRDLMNREIGKLYAGGSARPAEEVDK